MDKPNPIGNYYIGEIERNLQFLRQNIINLDYQLKYEIDRLRKPFSPVDDKDWEHLFSILPDTGHGKFWKAVMTEVRAALASRPKEKSDV